MSKDFWFKGLTLNFVFWIWVHHAGFYDDINFFWSVVIGAVIGFICIGGEDD